MLGGRSVHLCVLLALAGSLSSCESSQESAGGSGLAITQACFSPERAWSATQLEGQPAYDFSANPPPAGCPTPGDASSEDRFFRSLNLPTTIVVDIEQNARGYCCYSFFAPSG